MSDHDDETLDRVGRAVVQIIRAVDAANDHMPTPAGIIVWRFQDAPDVLRMLSDHGGDEDWLAVVPRDVEIPRWMETGTAFGCCRVSEDMLADGSTVCIGAHA